VPGPSTEMAVSLTHTEDSLPQEDFIDSYSPYNLGVGDEGGAGGRFPETAGDMNPADLLQFVIPHTFEEEGGRTGYLCAICLQFKHIYKANVRNHVESKHFKGQFVYKCEICGSIKNSKQDLYACKSDHKRSLKVENQLNNSIV